MPQTRAAIAAGNRQTQRDAEARQQAAPQQPEGYVDHARHEFVVPPPVPFDGGHRDIPWSRRVGWSREQNYSINDFFGDNETQKKIDEMKAKIAI